MIINFINLNLELKEKIDWETFVMYMEEFVEISKYPLKVKHFVRGISKNLTDYKQWNHELYLLPIQSDKYITCYNIKKVKDDIFIYEILQINFKNKSELIEAIKTMQLRAFI